MLMCCVVLFQSEIVEFYYIWKKTASGQQCRPTRRNNNRRPFRNRQTRAARPPSANEFCEYYDLRLILYQQILLSLPTKFPQHFLIVCIVHTRCLSSTAPPLPSPFSSTPHHPDANTRQITRASAPFPLAQ